MKVNGKFDVIDVSTGKRISGGENIFTNYGKQHFCNWLLHDNYSDDVAGDGLHIGQGGRSISDMRIVPYTDVAVKRVGTHSYVENPDYCMYPHNANYSNYLRLYPNNRYWNEQSGTYNDLYGTIFFEFTSAISLQAIQMLVTNINGWSCSHRMQFSTSPDTFITAQANNTWTPVKYEAAPSDYAWGDWPNSLMMYRFDTKTHPNKILTNVRSFRIRTCWWDWGQRWGDYRGVWFMQANPYPNTPSAIAIGTSDTAPTAGDTVLGAESLKKFILKHKTVNDNQVKYTMRIDKSEGNSTTFKEVGLFVNPTAGDYIGGDHQASVCTGMMSRGLFSPTWSKTSDQVIDIDYTLTLNN